MGNDGGSIPTRRELVKEAARAPNMTELKATALESLTHAWAHCFLTSAPLDKSTAVSDWRGRLYNYESVLKGLMPDVDAADAGETNFAATGIRSLRDIAKLKFHLQKRDDEEVALCPLSMKELGAATKAVYLIPCGHVFAEVALREVQERACPECADEFVDENVIPILPTEEMETRRLMQRMDMLRAAGLTHTLKKDKSVGKKKRKADEAANGGGDDVPVEKRQKAEKGKNGKPENRVAGINNPMAASLTAKVMAEQDESKRRRKFEEAYRKGQTSRA